MLNVDMNAHYLQRQARLNAVMAQAGIAALFTPDPINMHYATGTSNMTIWSLLGASRFLLHFAQGPTYLYEFSLGEHLSAHLPTITEIRTSTTSGGITAKKTFNYLDNAVAYAGEIADAVRARLGHGATLAVEGLDFPFTDALRAQGLVLADATALFMRARQIKTPLEIQVMRHAVKLVESAVAELEHKIEPGRSENEVWGEFHRGLIARGGQFTTTRLFQSGLRTFPYFHESSDNVMQAGDLVCLDTDAVGIHHYGVDFSRTFLCGDVAATPAQRHIYRVALEQVEHNASLLRPGRTYEEFARLAYDVPEKHRAYGYYVLAHGLGQSQGLPNVPRIAPDGSYNFPGEFEPNTVFCIESYVGDPDSRQGVKLEDEYLITETGVEKLSTYPYASVLR
jgi:Xaa-Pro dipeptidase